MPIGNEPNDNRVGFFEWNRNETFRMLETKDLTRIFGIPMGWHLFLERIHMVVADGEVCTMTLDPPTGWTGGGRPSIDGEAPIRPYGRQFVGIGLVTIKDTIKILNMPVYNNIGLSKGNANDIGFEIYYHFEPGAMMWLDEWADLLADKIQAPIRQSAGRVYNQVGDYFQMGRRERA